MTNIQDYETAGEVARRLHIDPSQVRRYCDGDRFEGATKISNRWFIPKGAKPIAKSFGRPPTWQD